MSKSGPARTPLEPNLDSYRRLLGLDDGLPRRARGDDGLPTLRHLLNSSLANLEWTVRAYNPALACMLALFR
ncbi:MAG: hypothetical protein QOF83_1399 [Solirubrobacteraceae bacterium]|nr:hypothetical protein [Solirubrobacteraceae bacterium]